MSKNKSAESHKSNQANKNIGTSGQNPANSKAHGNRGKQMNPTNTKKG